MPDLEPNPDSPQEQANRPVITVVVAAIVVVAVSISAWFLFHESPPKDRAVAGATIKLNMTSSEREYAGQLLVKNIALSRAENFLHQEVTILNGTVINGGTETVIALDVIVEFSDQMDQVALREARGILGVPAVPLAPGQERSFELSFEHVPTSWNMRQPSLHVSNLTLKLFK
jgi:hypothetical protein